MATRTAILGRSRAVWTSPALVDGLLAYAVAMAVGVAVFTSSADRQPGSWPAYLFALGFGLILLLRRRHPVLVLILTSLGICVYYTLDYPPIGLALPIAAALFSAAQAGQLRVESAAQRRVTTRTGMIDSQHSCAMIGEARYATGTEARKIAAGDRPITIAP